MCRKGLQRQGEIVDIINVARLDAKYGTLRFAVASTRIKMVSHDLDFQSAGGSKLKLNTVMVIGLERKLSVFVGDIYLIFKIFLQHELRLRTGNKAML